MRTIGKQMVILITAYGGSARAWKHINLPIKGPEILRSWEVESGYNVME
jgi:hypothetical protein